MNLFHQNPTSDGKALTAKEKLAWLQLTRTENVGPVNFFKLIEAYGTATKALEAVPEIAKRGGRKKPLKIPPLSLVEREYEALRKKGGYIITACEPDYPLALSALEDAPPVISVRGQAALLNKPCIGMVGARNASLNGRKFAEKLARDLGGTGQIIVSGLARGIDTAAHVGALSTGTIAVVAGGVDVVYPPENQALYDEICEKGLVVAESPLGQKPFAQSFPRRNRIVSGLSTGVVVVEATLKSGSLITARLAGEQGRDVYAVPGHPLDPRAAGPNSLIRDGAVLIRQADDVLEHLNNFTGGQALQDTSFSHFEPQPVDIEPHENNPQLFETARQTLLDGLSFTPSDLDGLIRQSGLNVPVVQTILLELELAGTVQRLPGNRIILLEE